MAFLLLASYWFQKLRAVDDQIVVEWQRFEKTFPSRPEASSTTLTAFEKAGSPTKSRGYAHEAR
jgi:hypothetical protein